MDGIHNLSSKCTCPKLLADLQPTIRAVKEEAERAAADDQSHEDRGPVEIKTQHQTVTTDDRAWCLLSTRW